MIELKNKCLLLFLALQCVSIIAAQDMVLKVNGDEIKAKVIEVGLTEIKYKRATNLTGPTYTVPISEVFMITYENGEKDVFGRTRKAATSASSATSPSAVGNTSTGQSGTNESMSQSRAGTKESNVSQTRKKEWTIFRTSNKEVIYTVKALVPEDEWDF